MLTLGHVQDHVVVKATYDFVQLALLGCPRCVMAEALITKSWLLVVKTLVRVVIESLIVVESLVVVESLIFRAVSMMSVISVMSVMSVMTHYYSNLFLYNNKSNIFYIYTLSGQTFNKVAKIYRITKFLLNPYVLSISRNIK